jgi:phosphatidylglycerophosphate synthase
MRALDPRRLFPWLLVLGRGILGPALVYCQIAGWSGTALATIVASGLLSDIYDGVLARRWKTDTDRLRLADSMADIVFYLGAAWSLAHRCPALWHAHRLLLVAMVTMEIERFAIDIVRFGKPSAYHAWLSKLAGLLLSTAVVVSFALSGHGHAASLAASLLLTTSLTIGLLSQAEGFAMSMLLPKWQRDVKSLYAAWRISTVLRRRLRLAPAL